MKVEILSLLMLVTVVAKYVDNVMLMPVVYEDLVEGAKYAKISTCVNQQQGNRLKNETKLSEDCIKLVEEQVGKCHSMEFVKIMTHHEEEGNELLSSNTGELHSADDVKIKYTNKGYIALDHHKKRIVLVFNGSKTWTDWLVDLSIMLVPYKPIFCDKKNELSCHPQFDHHCESVDNDDNLCKVHWGFFGAMKSLYYKYYQMIIAILKNHPDYEFWICGHSLGGAMAALFATEFKLLGYSPVVVTAGSPKVGNRATANLVNDLFASGELYNTIESENSWGYEATKHSTGALLRVRHKGDTVVRLPPGDGRFLYSHSGVEFCITAKDLPHTLESVRLVERSYGKSLWSEDEDDYEEEPLDQPEELCESSKSGNEWDPIDHCILEQERVRTNKIPKIKRKNHAEYFLVVTKCNNVEESEYS